MTPSPWRTGIGRRRHVTSPCHDVTSSGSHRVRPGHRWGRSGYNRGPSPYCRVRPGQNPPVRFSHHHRTEDSHL